MSARPQIVEYDPTWPEQFAVVAARVRAAPKHVTLAIGHIGSTAVPVFPAKDIIDVMAVVGTDSDLGSAADALPASGWSCARPG